MGFQDKLCSLRKCFTEFSIQAVCSQKLNCFTDELWPQSTRYLTLCSIQHFHINLRIVEVTGFTERQLSPRFLLKYWLSMLMSWCPHPPLVWLLLCISSNLTDTYIDTLLSHWLQGNITNHREKCLYRNLYNITPSPCSHTSNDRSLSLFNLIMEALHPMYY